MGEQIEQKLNANLKLGDTYLAKRKFDKDSIFPIFVQYITNKTYKFIYENGNSWWVHINNFNENYEIIENISEFIKEPFIDNKEDKSWKSVNYNKYTKCNGLGTLDDPNSTTRKEHCDNC